MWTIADFKGCIEYRPKMLKVQLLPYDECDIELITNNLDKARFIRFYSVQGKRYIKIVNFEKHQNPHKNERDSGSLIPDITEQDEESNNNNELKQDGTKPDLIGSARADSLLLIPSTLIPDSLIPSTLKPDTKKKAAAFALPDWIDKSKWDLWLKTRTKKMIPEQMQAQVDKLTKWRDAGLDYAKALSDAADAGWQGLQEPKPQRGGSVASQSENMQIREAARRRLFGEQENEIEAI
ncbi:MAG: hypothetical protein WC657_07550 [Candidatus Paceibacterota bacterium]